MTPKDYITLMGWALGEGCPKYPYLIKGDSGIGKTSIPEALASTGVMINGVLTKIPVLYFNATGLEPTDLTGLPFKEEHFTRYLTPHHMGNVKNPVTGKWEPIANFPKGVFILDEITRLDYQVRNTIMQFLDRREIGEFKLPEGWIIICTANPATEGFQVSELDKALVRRCILLDLQYDLEEWREWGANFGILPSILAVAGRVKNLASHLEDTLTQVQTPYGFQVCSDLLDSGLEKIVAGDRGEKIVLEVLSGAAGSGIAAAIVKGLSDKKLQGMLDCIMHGDKLIDVPTDQYLEVTWMFIGNALDPKTKKFRWPDKTAKVDKAGQPVPNPYAKATCVLYEGAPVDIKPMIARQFLTALIDSVNQDTDIQKVVQDFGQWTRSMLKQTEGGRSSKR